MGQEQRKIAADLCWGEELLKHQVGSILNDLNTADSWELADANAGMILTLLKSWELGNEPNSLPHQLNFSLPAKQLGRWAFDDYHAVSER